MSAPDTPDTQTPPPQRIGFIRVSTPEQRIDRQVLGLRDECDHLFIEEGSAVAVHRPVFEQAMARVPPGGTFTVWDLDRAFRSTTDALNTVERLRERGVHFRIISLNVDSASPEGELQITIMAAFAQFERRILSRRTKEGMEAARKRGAQIGRPRKLDADTIAQAHYAITEQGQSVACVATQCGVSRPTLQRAVKLWEGVEESRA